MGKEKRGEKLGSIGSFIMFYLAFAGLYASLVVFTLPLFMSWGAKRNMLEKAYIFFLRSPLNPTASLWLILVNALVWAFIIYFVVVLFINLIKKKRRFERVKM